MKNRIFLYILAFCLVLSVLAGCGQSGADDGLYFTQQEECDSPAWVTELDAAKGAEQMIVVAGVDKTTAYITMHEKNENGTWRQLIATPGFIGLDGLGDANINDCYTPVGTFTVDKAFGLAKDPGCQLEYTQVDDSYYWSGDPDHNFNELVSVKDVPDLDTENSEHIADYDFAYQYVLNMGYNSECEVEKGFAFFFHSFRVNRTYTGGCVAVPESVMKFIMQHIKPGCKFTIDSLENFGGSLDGDVKEEQSGESIPIETAEADGFTMNYFKFGHGEKTLVILPGLSVQGVMGSADQVALAYETMTEDFTVYVFDPRNELPSSYSVSEMAEDTAEVFQKLGLEHVYVMGASMGGMVAAEIAINHPELIEKMVLASSAVQLKEDQFQTLENWIGLAKEGDAEALYLAFGEDVYPQELFEQSRDLLVEASKSVTEYELKRFVILAESMRGFDITNDLDKIECPVLALSDQDDHVLGAGNATEIEQYMNQRPDWDFYLYQGYGHALYDTAPDFKDRMLGFFEH